MSQIDWGSYPRATHHTARGSGYHEAFWRKSGEKFEECWVIVGENTEHYVGVIGPANDCAITERPSPSWNGTGLPPVGVVCEYQFSKGPWYECEVKYSYQDNENQYAVIYCPHLGYEQHGRIDVDFGCLSLRPIRTPEQIAAEDREAAIDQVMDDLSLSPECRYIAKRVVDAGYSK